MYHDSSYSGTKTSANGVNITQANIYVQAHAWKHDPNQPKSRSKGSVDSIAREYGEEVFTETILLIMQPIL